MAVDDKCPQWIRLDTHDLDSPEVMYLMGGHTEADWANYGRLCALRTEIVRTGKGYVEVGNERHMLALGHKLGLVGTETVREFVELLLDAEICERAAFEVKGWLMMPDAWNQLEAYNAQVRANRANGRKGGRPRKDAQPEKPNQNPDETQQKPNQNPDETQQKPNQNPDETQQKPEPSSREEKITKEVTYNVTGQGDFSTIRAELEEHGYRINADGAVTTEGPVPAQRDGPGGSQPLPGDDDEAGGTS